jgi:predicted regulator of Ras-like GTPase activity (Roadblock/LC7/MglB family)
MFGFLKKLGKRNESAVVAAPVPVPATVRVPSPAQTARPANGTSRTLTPGPRPAAKAAPSPVPAPLPVATAEPAEPIEPPAPPVPVPSAKAPPTIMVELSLKKLWTKLNPEILRLAAGHPDNDAFLRLPLPLLQAQLAKGAVKLPLVQFRQYSPAGLFPANPDKDAVEVEIPISDVIPLLKPEHFARRPNQKKIEVPDDIGMIFGPGVGLKGLRVAEQKPRGSGPALNGNGAAPSPVQRKVQLPDGLDSIPDPFQRTAPEPKPVLPVPEAKIPAPKIPLPTAPKAPATVPVPSKAPLPKLDPATAAIPAKVAPAPLPKIAPVPAAVPPDAPIKMPAVAVAPLPEAPSVELNSAPIPAGKLDPKLASLRPPEAKAPAPVPPPAKVPAKLSSSAPQTPDGDFTLALMDVAAYWSEKGRNDLQNLYRHTVEIPMSTLERALKSGKLIFQWREIRPWLRLAAGNGMPNLADELPIELPLSIIAPRFMEARGGVRAKEEFDLGDIPEVFEQKVSAPAQNAAPTAPPLGATAVPFENAAALMASNSASKTGDTAFLTRTAGKPLLEFGEIFGQPDKKNWTLAEVAQKTLGLRGVAGAIIATSDGLLVAGSWPAGPKNDAVAAFIPQMYNKILQYSKELKIGEPTNFMLTIENVPLQIFKAGNSFFTVIGRAGENLPKAQLNAVATRLGTTHK